MNHFTPAEKLMQGIARIERVWTLAEEAAPIAPAPGGEALSEIHHLATEALLILNSLRGQIVGAP
jgi:hypothetical protein